MILNATIDLSLGLNVVLGVMTYFKLGIIAIEICYTIQKQGDMTVSEQRKLKSAVCFR